MRLMWAIHRKPLSKLTDFLRFRYDINFTQLLMNMLKVYQRCTCFLTCTQFRLNFNILYPHQYNTNLDQNAIFVRNPPFFRSKKVIFGEKNGQNLNKTPGQSSNILIERRRSIGAVTVYQTFIVVVAGPRPSPVMGCP